MSLENEQKILDKLDKIDRGLYGDDQNQQPGLIDRVQRLEELAKKLSQAKWYVLGALGVIASIVAAAKFIADLLKKISLS